MQSNPKSTKPIRQQLRNAGTPTELYLWEFLRQRRFLGLKFRRQHGIGPYILDFYCPALRLGIEVDGGIHTSQADSDAARSERLAEQGILVVRVRTEEVVSDVAGVLRHLEGVCQARRIQGHHP